MTQDELLAEVEKRVPADHSVWVRCTARKFRSFAYPDETMRLTDWEITVLAPRDDGAHVIYPPVGCALNALRTPERALADFEAWWRCLDSTESKARLCVVEAAPTEHATVGDQA